MGRKKEQIRERRKQLTSQYINTGDVDVDEICSDLEHSDADIVEKEFKKLRGMFSEKKGNQAHQLWTV